MAYITQTQCETYLAWLVTVKPGVKYQMDPLGNQINFHSLKDITDAIERWEALREQAIATGEGRTGGTVLVRRAEG